MSTDVRVEIFLVNSNSFSRRRRRRRRREIPCAIRETRLYDSATVPRFTQLRSVYERTKSLNICTRMQSTVPLPPFRPDRLFPGGDCGRPGGIGRARSVLGAWARAVVVNVTVM